jgi:hypothetical protein
MKGIDMKTFQTLICGIVLAGAGTLATAQSTAQSTDPAAKPTGKDDKRHGVAADTRPAGAVAAEEESA